MEAGSPTLEEASVRLLSMVLLPLDGLPTRPISGSRGMTTSIDWMVLCIYVMFRSAMMSVQMYQMWFRINVVPSLKLWTLYYLPRDAPL